VEQLKKIKMLIMDADGVLTDGRIIFGDDFEISIFDVHDGFGITLAKQAGLITAIISSRKSKSILLRAKQLGFNEICQDCQQKLVEYENLRAKYNLSDDEIACMGDDFSDIPMMQEAGFGIAVRNARGEVKEIADYTTSCMGGRGAVREVVELILKAQGKWETIVESFVKSKS
jgi:3-deoxy-D-manno-octulosonate 8-phosphate phosphatase (KDO 8-P phosphatase)